MPRRLMDPPEIPPEVLWRSLLSLRPSRSISYRICGAEHIPLIVKAIPAMAEAAAWDAGTSSFPPGALGSTEELRNQAGMISIISEVLWTPTGKAFGSSDGLDNLSEDEVEELSGNVLAALCDISPNGRRSNPETWGKAVKEGAAHHTNLRETFKLAMCIDVAPNGGQLPRPDRYWGVPFNELLEGNWMAYQAARSVVKDRS